MEDGWSSVIEFRIFKTLTLLVNFVWPHSKVQERERNKVHLERETYRTVGGRVEEQAKQGNGRRQRERQHAHMHKPSNIIRISEMYISIVKYSTWKKRVTTLATKQIYIVRERGESENLKTRVKSGNCRRVITRKDSLQKIHKHRRPREREGVSGTCSARKGAF